MNHTGVRCLRGSQCRFGGRFNQSLPSVFLTPPPPLLGFPKKVCTHLRKNLPQPTEQSTNPTTNDTLTREMPDAFGARSLTPSHVESEGLASVSPKKPLLRSVFSWLASVVRRYPFSSTILLYLILACGIALATKSSFNQNNREVGWPDDKYYRNADRVSF